MMTRMMRALLAGTIAVCGASPGWGATENSFLVRSTRDLVDVCAPAPSDPLATAAVNFCQGFMVGAYQYYTIDAAATNRQLFCPPSPLPSRNEAIAQFVTWAKARPAVLDQVAVEGMFRFLAERYPCPPQTTSASPPSVSPLPTRKGMP